MVALSAEVEALIRDRMKKSGYSSADDFMMAAIASFDQHQSISDLSSEEMEALYPGWREKIEEGLREAEAGNLVNGPEFFKKLKEEFSTGRTRR